MLVLGLDLETTGLDVNSVRIIEVGAVLWDTEQNKPVKIYSELLHNEDYPILSEEIVRITGITQADLEKFGTPPVDGLGEVCSMFHDADYIVAHNGNGYDRPIFERECKTFGYELQERHWVDTMLDIPYPESMKTRKLTHLAAEHNFVNPFSHRAIFDVLTMLIITSRYDFKEIVKLSKEESILVKAYPKPPWNDDGKDNSLVKSMGFTWNGQNKTWQKQVKKSQLEKLVEQANFKLDVVS